MRWNDETIKERQRLLGEAGISRTNYAWRTWEVMPTWVKRDIDFVVNRELRKQQEVNILIIERN